MSRKTTKVNASTILTTRLFQSIGEGGTRKVLVPSLRINEQSVSVFHKPIPASVVIEFMDESSLSGSEKIERMIKLLADVLVNDDGSSLTSVDHLKSLPMQTVTALLEAVLSTEESGNA